MGSSADAHVFFGFTFHDEDDPKRDFEAFDPSDWQEVYAAKKGVVNDSGMFNSEGGYALKDGTPEFKAARAKLDAFYEAKHVLLKALPFRIDHYGYSDGGGKYYVHLSRAHQSAIDWDAKELEVPFTRIKEYEKADMKAFCELMEIPWQEPKWYLAPYYG